MKSGKGKTKQKGKKNAQSSIHSHDEKHFTDEDIGITEDPMLNKKRNRDSFNEGNITPKSMNNADEETNNCTDKDKVTNEKKKVVNSDINKGKKTKNQKPQVLNTNDLSVNNNNTLEMIVENIVQTKENDRPKVEEAINNEMVNDVLDKKAEINNKEMNIEFTEEKELSNSKNTRSKRKKSDVEFLNKDNLKKIDEAKETSSDSCSSSKKDSNKNSGLKIYKNVLKEFLSDPLENIEEDCEQNKQEGVFNEHSGIEAMIDMNVETPDFNNYNSVKLGKISEIVQGNLFSFGKEGPRKTNSQSSLAGIYKDIKENSPPKEVTAIKFTVKKISLVGPKNQVILQNIVKNENNNPLINYSRTNVPPQDEGNTPSIKYQSEKNKGYSPFTKSNDISNFKGKI